MDVGLDKGPNIAATPLRSILQTVSTITRNRNQQQGGCHLSGSKSGRERGREVNNGRKKREKRERETCPGQFCLVGNEVQCKRQPMRKQG